MTPALILSFAAALADGGGAKGGDPSGLAADANGVFRALWADQRSGIGQVYTAAIEVGGVR